MSPREASLPKVAQHKHAPALHLLLCVADLLSDGWAGGGVGGWSAVASSHAKLEPARKQPAV